MKRTAITVLLLICILFCNSCGKNQNKPDVPGPIEIKNTIAPTYTPTPFPEILPVEQNVSATAYSTFPMVNGEDEPIWDFAPASPIEKAVTDQSDTTAYYRFLWSKNRYFLRITVMDASEEGSEFPELADHISVYVNENGRKPSKYGNGDMSLLVGRFGNINYGPGCNPNEIHATAYEIASGYVVELSLPFVTVRGEEGLCFGFDVKVCDYDKGKLVKTLCLEDIGGKTESTLKDIGSLTCSEQTALPNFQPMDFNNELWDSAMVVPLKNTAYGTKGAEASFRMLHDETNLYIRVNVKDETLDTDSPLMTRKDGVELFVNFDSEKPLKYRAGCDMHFRIGRDGELSCESGADENSIRYEVRSDESGYSVCACIRIPEAMLSTTEIGFDLHVNDSFGTQMRDYIVVWSDISLLTYSNLSKVGTVYLK